MSISLGESDLSRAIDGGAEMNSLCSAALIDEWEPFSLYLRSSAACVTPQARMLWSAMRFVFILRRPCRGLQSHSDRIVVQAATPP